MQPARCGGRNILDGMAYPFRKQPFIAWLGNDLFRTDRQLELPDHDGHEFIRRMDEIVQLSAGWIREDVAGIAAMVLVVRRLITVERYRELLADEIGHELRYWEDTLDDRPNSRVAHPSAMGAPRHGSSTTYCLVIPVSAVALELMSRADELYLHEPLAGAQMSRNIL